MSKRLSQVSPFCDASQFATLRGNITFMSGFSPGFLMLVEGCSTEVLSLHRETKFITSFDFAVTLSSPESYCVLFDITPEQSVELKWLMLNKHRK